MKLHCDSCQKEVGEYLYGKGGVEEMAMIFNLRRIGLPDIICNQCRREGYHVESNRLTHHQPRTKLLTEEKGVITVEVIVLITMMLLIVYYFLNNL